MRLVELFKDHLVLHSWGEETFFYPVVRARISANSPIVNAAYLDQLDGEDATIDADIDRLEREVKAIPISNTWPLTFQKFIAELISHMDKEENELFPFSEGLLGVSGLDEISNELERRRKEAPFIRRHSAS